jgi:spore germination protein YaaH
MFITIRFRPIELFFRLILVLFLALPILVQAQIPVVSGTQNIGSRLEKESTKTMREEVSKQKSTVKNEARTTIKDAKKLPTTRKGLKGQEEEYKPTLEELIEDEEAKGHIENTTNKTRFINLFGQWMTMPSAIDVKLRAERARKLDSLQQVDSSLYRVPKKVKDQRDQFMTIFGWHPHFNGNTYKTYNYRLMTAIAYYSYDVDPETGSYLDSTVIHDFLGGEDPAGGIVPTAHENDCKVLLSISSHSLENNYLFLEPQSAIARQNLIDQIVYLLDTSKADGIEINFENIPVEYQDEFYKFVKRISYTLRSINPDYSVCMSVPAYDPNNTFNLARMRDDIDFFIIKGFDFHDDPSSTTGPVKKPGSPLNFSPASGEEDLRSVVERYIASIGPYYANHLILALSNYGTLWETDDKGYELTDYVPYSEIQYDFIQKDSAGIRFDSTYFSYVWSRLDTLWANQERTKYDLVEKTLYYDDVKSLRIKYQFLQEYGLAGVGIWPLGYDIGFDHVWNTLEEEFTTIEMPEIEGLEQLTAATKRARSWSTIILTVLLFWTIFATAGFCMSLFNVEARRALFQNGRFRMVFLCFFSLLILLLGSFFGLFAGKTSMLMLGVVIGALFAYGILVILDKQRAKAP